LYSEERIKALRFYKFLIVIFWGNGQIPNI